MSLRHSNRLLWMGVGGIGIGVGALSAAHWHNGPISSSTIAVFRSVPLNLVGVTAHYAASVPLPGLLRSRVYKSYCVWTGCDPNETDGSLTDFRSLADFFGRSLRPEVRPIDKKSALVVPCDGTIIDAGPVEAYGKITVKNVSYQIRDLVGASEREPLAISSVAVADREESGSRLWYTVIHIAPGHCHRFSSPASWDILERRHIPGHLLWLNPEVKGLYTENERIAMLGKWNHGLFSLTAVGAAGRGSINLQVQSNEESFRPQLRTKSTKISNLKYHRIQNMLPGDPIGGFRFGSAIVLLFEAPERALSFHVKPGDNVKLGQALASVADVPYKRPNEDTNNEQPVQSRRHTGTRRRFKRAW